MNNNNHDQDKHKKQGGGFTAGLVLGAVGAAAGAAAVALSNKGNQRKIEKAMDSLKDKGEKFRAQAMKKLDMAERNVDQKVKSVKGDVDAKMKEAKGEVAKTKRKVAAVKRAVK